MANPFGTSVKDLRKQYPVYDQKGYTDEEIVLDIAERVGMDLRSAADYVGVDLPESDLGLSASMGATGFKGTMAHAGQAYLGQDNREYIHEQKQRNELLAGVAQQDPSSNPLTWEETTFGSSDKGIQDFSSQLLFGSLPHMAGPVIGGLGGLAVGGPPGALAGAMAGGLPSSGGLVSEAQYDQSGRYDVPAGLPLVVGHAALNLLGPEAGIVGRVGGMLPRLAKGRVASGGIYAGLGAGSEAIAEGEQTRLEQMAKGTVDPTYDINSPEAQRERTEGRIGGALLGGMFGGPIGLTNPITDRSGGNDGTTPVPTPRPPISSGPTDLLSGRQLEMFDPAPGPAQGDLFDGDTTPRSYDEEPIMPAVPNPNQRDMFDPQMEFEFKRDVQEVAGISPEVVDAMPPHQREELKLNIEAIKQKAQNTAKEIFKKKPAQLRALQTLRDNPDLASRMGNIEEERQAKLDYRAEWKRVQQHNKKAKKEDKLPYPQKPDFKTGGVAATELGKLLGISKEAASKNVNAAYETLSQTAAELDISPEMLLRRLRLEPRSVAPPPVDINEFQESGTSVGESFALAQDENNEVTVGREDLALGQGDSSIVPGYSVAKTGGDTKSFRRSVFDSKDYGVVHGDERQAAARKAAKMDAEADKFLKKHDKLSSVASTRGIGKQWNQMVKKFHDEMTGNKTLRWAQLPPEAKKAFADEFQQKKGQLSKKRIKELGEEALRFTPVGKPEVKDTTKNKAAEQAETDAYEAKRLYMKHRGQDIDVETSAPTIDAQTALEAVSGARRAGRLDALEDKANFEAVMKYMRSVVHRRNDSGKSTAKQVENWLKGPLKKLASWVNVEIKQSVSEVPSAGLDNHPADAAGMVVAGKVYLIADNIGTRREALTTLAHEVVGHVGVEQMLGPAGFENLLDAIRLLKKNKDRALALVLQQIKKNYRSSDGTYNLDERTEAREIIAHFAENNPSVGWFRRVVAAIKLWFARRGFGDLNTAIINKILADASTVVTNELNTQTSQVATEDAYARTGEMRRQMYDERIDAVWDAYENREYLLEKRDEFHKALDAYGKRLRQSGHELLAKLGEIYVGHRISEEESLRLFRIRDFLIHGNTTGLTADKVLPLAYDEKKGHLTFIIAEPVGPFKNGVAVRLTFQNDIRTGHSSRTDGVSMTSVPMENATDLYPYDPTSEGTNEIMGGHLWPHTEMLQEPEKLKLWNSKRSTPITVPMLLNTLESSAWGPMFSSRIQKEFFPEADVIFKDMSVEWVRHFDKNGDGPKNEWFSSHLDASETPYIRFNGLGTARSRQYHAMLNRFHYYFADMHGLSQPNFYTYRETGANPINLETGEGKHGKKAKLPVFRTNQRMQKLYRRTGSNYAAPESKFNDTVKQLKFAYRSMADKAPALLSLHALHDVYGEKLSRLKDYYNAVSAMENMQQKMQNNGHKVAMKWNALTKDTKNKLDSLMMQATLAEAHPDLAFDNKKNEHLKPEERAQHAELARKYNALPEEAKEVYQLVKKRLAADWRLRKQIYRQLVNHAFDERIKMAEGKEKAELTKERDAYIDQHAKRISSVRGPYFPLNRFGAHVVSFKSEAFKQQQKRVDETPGPQGKIEQRKLAAMQKDPAHYWVRHFDEQRKAMQLADAWAGAQHFLAYNFENRNNQDITQQGIQKVAAVLEADMTEKGMPADAVRGVKAMLSELYVQSLPENSAIQNELKRKKIEGAEKDMLRSFAANIERTAFHLSRLKHRREVTEQLYDLKIQANKHSIKEQHVAVEVMKRHALDVQYFDQPIQNFVAKLSGIYHLFTPSYWLVNATQPWFIGAPYLAARYGMGRSLSALRRGFADGAKVIQHMIKENGLLSDIDVSSLKSREEQDMLKFLINKGRIDINITHDLGVIARGDTDAVSRLSRITMWPAHQVEVVNRIMVALATYRMARSSGRNGGMSHDAATELADKAVIDTQVDYSNVNAARFMKHGAMPLGKLVWQFRKYQHAMVQLLLLNAKKGFPVTKWMDGTAMTAKEIADSKQARATLGYMLGTQFVTAGLVGMPMANVVGIIADALIDDDDEAGDARTQMYNALVDNIGKEMADLVVKGVPAALLGTDMTKRTGMGDMFSLMPFLRTDGYTGHDQVGSLLVSAGGAPVSLAVAAYDAALFANDGQWQRAIESVMPKGIKDIFKSYRYTEEGITSRNGVVGLESEAFGAWDVVQRSIGLTPMKEASYWDAKTDVRETSEAIASRKSRLRREYAAARANNDSVEMSAIREAVREFNKDHPKFRITGSDLWRAYKNRRGTGTDEMNLGRSHEKLKGLTRYAN